MIGSSGWPGCFLLICGLLNIELSAGSRPAPEELINNYMRTVNTWSNSVSMNIHNISTFPGNVYERNAVFHYDRSSKRLEWLWSLTRPEGIRLKKITMFEGKDFVSVESKGDRAYSGFVKRTEYDKHFSLDTRMSQWGGWLRGKTIPLGQEYDIDFCDYLLTQSKSLEVVGTDELSGQLCHVLEAVGKYDGERTRVWIAPSMSYNIMKITQSRPDSSNVPLENRRNPESNLRKSEALVLIDEFTEINEVFVPVSGRLKRTEGDKEVLVTVKQSNIVINPDFEEIGAFSYESLPDGTLLADYDHPGVQYKVLGGKLAANLDETAIAAIDELMSDFDSGMEQETPLNASDEVLDIVESNVETVDNNEIDPNKSHPNSTSGSARDAYVYCSVAAILILCLFGFIYKLRRSSA